MANPLDNPAVNRGVKSLKPADSVAIAGEKYKEDLNVITPITQAELDALSSSPQSITIYEDGEIANRGRITDGDSFTGERLAFNYRTQGEDHRSLDTWEVFDPRKNYEHKDVRKKMDKQRAELARRYGVPLEDISDEDVFLRGALAKSNFEDRVRDAGGAFRREGETKDSTLATDRRRMGEALLDSQNQDIRDAMNNPMDNASFFSRYNVAGRLTNTYGSSRRRPGEDRSDVEARLDGVENTSTQYMQDTADSMAGGLGDAFAKPIAIVGAKSKDGGTGQVITADDERIFKEIGDLRQQAKILGRQAHSEAKFAQKNARIDSEEAAAIAGLRGELAPIDVDLYRDSGVKSAEEFENEIIKNNLNKEQRDFINQVSTYGDITKGGSGQSRAYDILTERARIRGDINKAIGETGDKGLAVLGASLQHVFGNENYSTAMEKNEQFMKERTYIDPVTGASDIKGLANRAIVNDSDSNPELIAEREASKKAWTEGEYGKAAYHWVNGAKVKLSDGTGAAFIAAAESIPSMVGLVRLPKLVGIGMASDKYEESREAFYELNGEYPDRDQSDIQAGLAVLSTYAERGGAELAIGKGIKGIAGEKAGKLAKDLSEKIAAKTGVTVGMGAAFVAGSLAEGGEEMLVSFLDQAAARQGQDSLFDIDEVFTAWTTGVAAGAVTKAIMESPKVPQAIKNDLLAFMEKTGLKLPEGSVTPKAHKKKLDAVLQFAAEDSNQDIDTISTPRPQLDDNVDTEIDFDSEESIASADSNSTSTKTSRERRIEQTERAETLIAGDLTDPTIKAKAKAAVEQARIALINELSELDPDEQDKAKRKADSVSIAESEAALGAIASMEREINNVESVGGSIPVNDTGDVGLLFSDGNLEPDVQGSAPGKKADTASLNKYAADLIARLKQYDTDVKVIQDSNRKNAKQVRGESLGTRTNVKGKKGLGAHLMSMGQAVVDNSRTMANAVVKDLSKFVTLQREKQKGIAKAIADYKQQLKDSDRKNTEPVVFEYGTDNKESFIVEDLEQAERFLKLFNEEVKLLKKGQTLAIDMAMAHFSPVLYEKRLAQRAADKTKAALEKELDTSPAEEQQTAPEATEETSEASKDAKEEIEPVTDEVAPNTDAVADDVKGAEESAPTSDKKVVEVSVKDLPNTKQGIISEGNDNAAEIKRIQSTLDKGGLKADKRAALYAERKVLNARQKELKKNLVELRKKEAEDAKNKQEEAPKNTLIKTEAKTVNEAIFSLRETLRDMNTPHSKAIVGMLSVLAEAANKIGIRVDTHDSGGKTLGTYNAETKTVSIDVSVTNPLELAAVLAQHLTNARVKDPVHQYFNNPASVSKKQGTAIAFISKEYTEFMAGTYPDGSKLKQLQDRWFKRSQREGGFANNVAEFPGFVISYKELAEQLMDKDKSLYRKIISAIGIALGFVGNDNNAFVQVMKAVEDIGLDSPQMDRGGFDQGIPNPEPSPQFDDAPNIQERTEAKEDAVLKTEETPEVLEEEVLEETPEVVEEEELDFEKEAETTEEIVTQRIEDTTTDIAEINLKAGESPVIKSFINWTKGIVYRFAEKSDSSSTSALRAIGKMLGVRKGVKYAAGLIAKTDDLFTAIAAEFTKEKGLFEEKHKEIIQRIQEFSIEFSDALDTLTPELAAGGKGLQPGNKTDQKNQIGLFAQLVNRSPTYGFLSVDNELAPVLKDAMAMAMLEWVRMNGSSSMFQTEADVHRFLGTEANQGDVNSKAITRLMSMGMHAVTQETMVGLMILKMLDLKQDPDKKLDGMWEARLAQSLGTMAFIAMANMESSPKKGPKVNRGYLEYKTISVSDINKLTGQTVIGEDIDEESGEDKRVVTFLKIPNVVDDRGLPVRNLSAKGGYAVSGSVQTLFDITKSEEFKFVIGKITGSDARRSGGVSPVPFEVKQGDYVTNSSSQLTPEAIDDINRLNKHALVKNNQWKLMKTLLAKGDEGRKEWLVLQGWMQPEVNKEGKESFPDMHEADETSQLGRNIGLEGELDRMLRFEAEWAADYESAVVELQTELAFQSELALAGSTRDIQAGKERIDALQAEVDAYANGDIYLEHHAIRTGRINDKSRTLSYQRSKSHRNAMSLKKNIELIDVNNADHVLRLKAALVDPLGLNKKRFKADNQEEFARKIMDDEGNFPDPVIAAAVEYLQLSEEDKQNTSSEPLAKAVEQLKEKSHSLSALMTLSDWSKTIKQAKEDPLQSVFVSHAYAEVDGTTNGVQASTRQLAGGFKVEDMNDPKSATYALMNLLRAGGHIFEGDGFEEAMDYLEKNDDAYENLGRLAQKKFAPLMTGAYEGKSVEDLKALVEEREKVLDEMYKQEDSRPTPADIQKAEQDIADAKGAIGVAMFGTTLPKFGSIEGGDTLGATREEAKTIRELMKAIVMPGGYQAGDYALAKVLFESWLRQVYRGMNEGSIAEINAVLANAGITNFRVNTANKRKVFPAHVIAKLREEYINSIGFTITAAYRESTGEFDQNAKIVNASFNIQGIVVAAIQKKALADLEATKGRALTPEEIMEEKQRLHKLGVFVGIKQATATGPADSIAIMRTEWEETPKDSGGYVYTPLAKGKMRSKLYGLFPDEFGLKNDFGVKDGNVETESRTARLRREVPSADIGVRGLLTSIINMDSITNALAGAESNSVRGNLYDAVITGVLNAATEAEITNKVWNDLHNDFSLWNAADTQLDKLMDILRKDHAELTKDIHTAIGTFLKKEEKVTSYSDDFSEEITTKTGNRHAPTYVNEQGYKRYFKSYADFSKHFKQEVKKGDEQRKLINSLIRKVEQFVSLTPKQGGHTVKKVKTDGENVQGSAGADGRIDMETFAHIRSSPATPEIIRNLFNEYVNRPNNPEGVNDSPEHIENLNKLMREHIIPMLTQVAGYSIKVDRGEGTLGGLIDNDTKTIFIRSSDTAIRRFGTDMSDAEVLTHELLHPIVRAGLAGNTAALRTLAALQKAARDSNKFTVANLMDSTTDDSEGAKARAEALYDYVNGDIEEFMVFGLSNDRVRTLLEKVTVQGKKKAGIIEGMLNVLRDLVSRLMGRTPTARTEPSNVRAEIDTLIKSFETTTSIHRLRQAVEYPVKNKVAVAVSKALADNVGTPYSEWSKSPTFVPGQRITAKEAAIVIAKTPGKLSNGEIQKSADKLVREITDTRTDPVSGLANEVLGATEVDRPIHADLSENNEQIDARSIQREAVTKKTLSNGFIKEVSVGMQRLLTDTLIRGGLRVFKMPMVELANLVGDTKAVDARIAQTLSALNSTNKDWINNQAMSLANVMMNGKALDIVGNLGNPNAYAIAVGINNTLGANAGRFDADDTQLVAELRSLYAIKLMSDETRNKLEDIIRKEPHGIQGLLEMDELNYREALQLQYKDDKSRPVDGFVRTKTQNRSTFVIKPRREHAELEAAGFTLVKTLGPYLATYSRPEIPMEEYQKGAFSLANSNLEGTFVTRRDRIGTGGPNLIPVLRGGEVVGYRAILDKETRELEMGPSEGVFDTLANQAGRNIRLPKGNAANAKLVKTLYDDYSENRKSNPKAFLRLSAKSTNRQIAEFVKLMPQEMRDEIQELWGGDMYIRKSQLNLLIGYRKLSIVDAYNRGRVDRGHEEMNKAIAETIKLAETTWQELIGIVKHRTVIFTPTVFTANFLSNLAVSVLQGMNPVDVVRWQKEGLSAILQYTSWQRDLAEVQLEYDLGRDMAKNKKEIKRLENVMAASGIHNMMEAGMFQSIVEDIDLSGETSAGPLDGALLSKLPISVKDTIADSYKSSPKLLQKGVATVMLHPSTKLGAQIQAATAYSDFVARYALMKHLDKEGVSEADAMVQARETFVDYAPNTSRELQYINDMGFYMYTKFLLRIQAVIMRAFKERPGSVIGFELAQQILGDYPDVVDSSLAFGLSMSGGRSQNPFEVLEMISQFPLAYLFRGALDLL